MKTIISFFLIAFSLSAFSQNLRTVTTYHDYLQTKKNEVYTAEPNTLSKQGIYKRYDELGTLIEESTYSKNKLQGIRKVYYDAGTANTHTKPTDYYGKLFAIENYKDDVLVGEAKEFQYINGKQCLFKEFLYANGKEIKLVEYYVESTIIASFEINDGDCFSNFKSGVKESVYKRVNNNIHGNYVKYYENGQIANEGLYTNGVKTGSWKTYYESGVLKIEEQDVKVGECSTSISKEYSENSVLIKSSVQIKDNEFKKNVYSSEGKLLSEVTYMIDNECKKVKNGIEKIYFEKGNLSQVVTYVNNEISGHFEKYYESGKLMLEGDGGISKFYYEDGTIQKYIETIDGGKELDKEYYPNGNLKSEGCFYILRHEQIGDSKYYKEDGTLDYIQSEQGLKTTGSEIESREIWNKIKTNIGQSQALYNELYKKCGAYCAGSDCTVEKKKDIFTAGREIYESITKKLDSRTNPVPKEEAFTMSEQMRKSLEKCVGLVDTDSKEIEKLLRKASTLDEKIQILTN